MRLAYNGAPFHGWQSQPGDVATVQGTLEKAVSLILRTEVAITGAGRTDTGVSAREMFAHFDLPDDTAIDPLTLPRAINAITGPAIAVYEIRPVAADMHARFSVRSRTYRYFVTTRRSPFFNNLAWFTPANLDFDAMNRAAEMLLSVSDFTSFSKLHTDAKTNICRVTEARWTPVPNVEGAWMFTITADRFLRNMVRAVVGTLVEVGRGKMTLGQFSDVVAARNRCAAGTSMPAHALYLWEVKY